MDFKKHAMVGTTVVLILAVGGGSYFLGLKRGMSLVQTPQSQTVQQAGNEQSSQIKTEASPIGPSSLIKQQQALAEGIVTKVETNSLTLKSQDGSVEATFTFSPTMMVYFPPGADGKLKLGTTDKSAIVTGKPAAVELSLENGQYLIKSITYLKTL